MKEHGAAGVVAVSVLLTACSSSESPTPSAVQVDPLGTDRIAIVDGDGIPASVFEILSLAATQRPPSELSPAERERLIEQIVTIQLLATEAERNGLSEETRVAAEVEFQRLQLMARAMTERFRLDNAPTEAELRQAYEDNLPRFLNTQFKARHILVETEDEAASLIAELDSGADFAELAREHSTGPTGPDGGDLGWFSADSMVAPFGAAVQEAEVGKHYPTPVQTRFGWHVILVEDRRDQQAPGLEAVRAELVTEVSRRKLEAYVTSLREAAEVVVDSSDN